MDFSIEHEIPGRMRIRLAGPVPDEDLDAFSAVLEEVPHVEKAVVYPRIGSAAVRYRNVDGARDEVARSLSLIDPRAIDEARSRCAVSTAPRAHALMLDLAALVGFHFARRLFAPPPLRAVWAVWRYRRFLKEALRSLCRSRLGVPVLDAAAIGMSFLKRDPKTASETMFLLDIGETLEDYTRARSENELIHSLLAVPETAQRIEGGREVRVSSTELTAGDLVVVRTGMPVCVDGVVEHGVAMVNQSTLTGEPLAVERSIGDDVFAGTAVEEGEIFVRVKSSARDTKLRSIVALVELSESLKAGAQTRRERLADAIVPWNFLLAGVVALTTRSFAKTSAALMVDYSCALKLTGSIAVLSAMSQSAKAGFTVKGSRCFEEFAAADTIVFDKTGTLTEATPQVACVIALDGWNRGQILRLAACLEEHFPHPVARAVVRAAAERNLKHRERHAEVEYIVAHGIASSLDGKRVVIGSEHFVIGDEGVSISDIQRAKIDAEAGSLSVLYLAVDGKLVGAIGIEDPLKPDAAESIARLRELGFERVVMLTGDNERAAARIAGEAGIDEYEANLLPEQKHAYVERLVSRGRRVIMVGDGVNDSPALSAANVGVAMATGTAIAKEVADITLSDGDVASLVSLRKLSRSLMRRLDASFAQVIAVNSALLAGGVTGVVTPQASSLLHNASTVALSLRSSVPYRV